MRAEELWKNFVALDGYIVARLAGADETTRKAMEQRLERGKSLEGYKIYSRDGKFEVKNGKNQSYFITIKDGSVSCTCPDFTNRGLGLCKHIGALHHALGKLFTPQAKQAKTEAVPGRTTEVKPEPTDDPAQVIIHWGKHKGRTLGEIAQENPGFVAWLAFKMQPKTPEDEKLQKAARRVHDSIKGQRRKQKAGKADPVMVQFLALAGIDVLHRVWQAQEKRIIDDSSMAEFLERQMKAVKLVAQQLRVV